MSNSKWKVVSSTNKTRGVSSLQIIGSSSAVKKTVHKAKQGRSKYVCKKNVEHPGRHV